MPFCIRFCPNAFYSVQFEYDRSCTFDPLLLIYFDVESEVFRKMYMDLSGMLDTKKVGMI
jgi:hypothetical protein